MAAKRKRKFLDKLASRRRDALRQRREEGPDLPLPGPAPYAFTDAEVAEVKERLATGDLVSNRDLHKALAANRHEKESPDGSADPPYVMLVGETGTGKTSLVALLAAAQAAAQQAAGDPTAERTPAISSGLGDDLSPAEAEMVVAASAAAINHTLARLFLRLGPPPEGADGDITPVSSGGGGAQQ
ncbi:hypothetical protein ABZ864_44125 [Streptomyces sp. NPDC047082]|uniref:hypothetical protein n=1 Tax=Streptomyces sp. NPDC047082 TaxID=3155259 RepID=UPI0033EE7DD7